MVMKRIIHLPHFSFLLSHFTFLLVLLFVACDKISPDEYTAASGADSGTGDWTNGGTQYALVEKYTGPRCTNCPAADVTLDALHAQFGDKLIVISINHPVGQGEPFPNQPDMRTAAGTAWDQYFGINAIPAALLNRDRTKSFSGTMENLGNAIAAVVGSEPVIRLDLTAEADTASRQLDITAAIHLYSDIETPLTLTLALTEDSLVYRQSTSESIVPDYVHNHMLREVITATWGDEVPLSGVAGEEKQKHFTYTVANPDIRLENCHVVGFLSRKDNRTVLNSAQQTVSITSVTE